MELGGGGKGASSSRSTPPGGATGVEGSGSDQTKIVRILHRVTNMVIEVLYRIFPPALLGSMVLLGVVMLSGLTNNVRSAVSLHAARPSLLITDKQPGSRQQTAGSRQSGSRQQTADSRQQADCTHTRQLDCTGVHLPSCVTLHYRSGLSNIPAMQCLTHCTTCKLHTDYSQGYCCTAHNTNNTVLPLT